MPTMTTTLRSIDAKHRFGDAVARVEYGHERIVITHHGRPVAALVSIADLEAIEGKATKRAQTRRGNA